MSVQSCSVDADALRLIAFLRDPASDPDLPTHILQCRFCQIRLFRLASAAAATEWRRHLNHSDLADWIDLLADDENALPFRDEHAPLLAHMLSCSECFERYQEVRRMTDLDLMDSLPALPPGVYRPPDLSLLRSPWDWITAPLTAARAGLVRVLRIDLGLLLQPPALLPALAQRHPPLAAADAADIFQSVTLGADELGSLEVSVRLLPVALDPAAAQVEVEVFLPDRLDLDLSGTSVLMRLPDQREIVHTTNADGYVRFGPVAETDLRGAVLEIMP